MPRKNKPRSKLVVTLPVIEGRTLGGLHQEICTAEGDFGVITLSGGFGLGHSEIYADLNGKRILTVDSAPVLRGIIEEALARRAVEKAHPRQAGEGVGR